MPEHAGVVFLVFFLTGGLAGVLNAVVGGGTYFTFPLLIMFGLPPVLANTTNKIAVWFGSLASAGGYRAYIPDTRREVPRFYFISVTLGSVAGSALLFLMPSNIFQTSVPWLVLLSALLFAFGKTMVRSVRNLTGKFRVLTHSKLINTLSLAIIFLIGVYGGFFGAGMSLMLMALYEVVGVQGVHRMNGLKALTSFIVNTVSALIFIFVGSVYWSGALAMSAGALVGGYCCAVFVQRLPERPVRWFIVAYSFAMSLWLFLM